MAGRRDRARVVERAKPTGDIAPAETPLRCMTPFKSAKNTWVPAD